MKKRNQVVALLLSFCLLSGCAGSGGETSSMTTLNSSDYETDKTIITIVDCPPNPLDETAMELYMNLGVNTYVLTEDYTPMVENKTVSEIYRKTLESLGEKGLNVWVRNMWNDPDYFMSEQAKEGSNYGTPYTMGERDITTEFSEYTALTGFYMADELYMHTLEDDPTTEPDESLYCAMDQMDKLIEWKNKYYPDAFWHINHVPSSSYDHWPKGNSYADFIQHYVDTILRKVESGGRSLCLDNYPLVDGGKIKDSYILDLLTVANIARDYNAEMDKDNKANFGICLQTFANTNPGFEQRDIVSSDDITFQMYSGMACGASLFEYFCWRSYSGLNMYGIVDEAGKKRIYDYIKEANDVALPFQKVVLAFEWQGLAAKKGEMSGKDDVFGDIQNLVIEDTGSLKSINSRYDTIVGCFDKEGQDGYMVVNYTDPINDFTNSIMLQFDNCKQALVYTEEGVEQINLTSNGELRLVLEAGQAAFVIPV